MASRKDEPLLWERREGESGQAWEAFRTFRDLGETRTLAAVAQELRKSDSLIRRWAKTHEWKKRVLAYDNELQKQELAELKKRRKKDAAQLYNLASHIFSKGIEGLNQLDTSKMTPREILQYLQAAVELQEQASSRSIEALENSGDTEEQAEEKQTVHIILPDNGRQ